MKKLGLLVMPLMTISFLVSCGPKVYTITFNCTNCKAFDENGKEVIKAKVKPSSEIKYNKFYFKSTDSNYYYLPFKCDVSVKNKKGSVEEYSYDASTGELVIPNIGNLNVNASGFKKNSTLEECTWNEISEISTTGRAKEFFKIGDTKKVQLKHQDAKGDGANIISEGELYQTVRIIGLNEDHTELPIGGKDADSNNVIGITFEFANLISDENGYSIAAQWNDINDEESANYNYLDSTIRTAVVGEKQDRGHILWAQKDNDHWSNEEGGPYTNKSVLDMLPEELSKVLVGPQKTVQCYNHKNKKWSDVPMKNNEGEYDKLFLLSHEEVGSNADRTGAYTYYQELDETKLKSLRLKKQVKGEDIYSERSYIPRNGGQKYLEEIINFAGYNSNPGTPSGGAESWLRSPSIDYSVLMWSVLNNGSLGTSNGCKVANGVAPAFCV